ncbi:hypothetical protein CMEL01_05908 [Colletotrichum melonis]|uniref:Uncharacterized protein n=1 Tax=Colletotrichum melonis TaxID=1209925 RepID=A0AAI9U8E1_9PEZI|nr:hypothetical protein CMEL01_05908 [Colletotrichum melonis]
MVSLDPCFRFTRHVRRSDGGPRISRSPQVLQGSPHRGMFKNRAPRPLELVPLLERSKQPTCHRNIHSPDSNVLGRGPATFFWIGSNDSLI